jgi:aspartyl-tRNA(Asn)/glutamyl-tRNA(Gln) amidotransferase subunit A
VTRRELVAAVLAGAVFRPQRAADVERADELTSLSVTAAAAGIAAGRFTAGELTEAYLSRIARIDAGLGAFVTVTANRARAEARRRPRGPLGGVPVAHKDLFETAGILTTAGSRLYERFLPARDAFVVARLAAAGAVMLGKTNTHELGGGVTTINPFYGTTRNPADPSRIAGGSSGGSAVAVAARLSAAATGSDTGGSVRIPAALCGVVGFKPTFGRVHTAGLLGACPTFDHVGFLARRVDDVALLYRAAADRPVSALLQDARSLRVGIARPFFFEALHPDVAASMERAFERFRALGASVRDAELPIDRTTMSRVFDPIVASEIWRSLGPAWRTRPHLFSPEFAAFFRTPAPAPAAVAVARRALRDFQERVDRAFVDLDVIVTPTVPVTAPPIAGPIDSALVLRNTWPFNAARTPAISVPCGVDRLGLPIGLQLAAARGRDDAVLDAARLFTGE